MEINNKLIGVVTFFLAMNLLTFFVMLSDKLKSRKNNAERISEGTLFFLATTFGSLGMYAGMFAFRHKTQICLAFSLFTRGFLYQ